MENLKKVFKVSNDLLNNFSQQESLVKRLAEKVRL